MANKTPSVVDQLISQIPGNILQNHPRFYDFLSAYYEWLCQEGNPYGAIKDHLDYLSFEKSLDEYTEHMKNEYLSDVPDSVLLDKELFIKWSKKFNLARGSHASYLFLFRLLFGEQTTSIYLPKENILKTSDGVWISGESLMYVTHNTNNIEQFQYQIIRQERPIYGDIVEVATATVQNVQTRYVGRYVVTELSIADIRGEFKTGYPIESQNGAYEWIIPTITQTSITDGGANHTFGERIFVDSLTVNDVERVASEDGSFDTRITSLFDTNDVSVMVNGSSISSYTFEDGRYVVSNDITDGDTVKVELPAYQGYLTVNEISDVGGVEDIAILDLPIGKQGSYSLSTSNNDAQFDASASTGLVKPVAGYYEGTRGQLSSNMYLQDSYFYQNYSYAIRTQQDFTAYADIVKRVLHPAGFVLFGQLSFINIIELILTYQDQIDIPPTVITNLHKYGLGGNYNFVNRFKDGASIRLYKQSDFDSLDQDYLNGESGYDLESKYLADRISSYDLAPIKGWMSKFNWADYYLYVPQDYSDEDESGDLYFETGYTSTRTS